MSTYTAHTTVAAAPCEVLGVLTDPDAIERWSRSGGGLTGRLMAQATDALLRAGALDGALGRIAREVELTHSL